MATPTPIQPVKPSDNYQRQTTTKELRPITKPPGNDIVNTSSGVGYNNDIFLVDLITLEKMKIQFVPKTLNFEDESSFVAINSPGRNNPFYHYTGGEDVLTFTLDYYAAEENRFDALIRCKWVKALTRGDAYNNPPHIVQIIWGGRMFDEAYWIITKATYQFTLFDGSKNMLPIQAYQDLVLKRVTTENVNLSYIRSIST